MCALPLERAEDAGGVYSNIRELGSKKGYTLRLFINLQECGNFLYKKIFIILLKESFGRVVKSFLWRQRVF